MKIKYLLALATFFVIVALGFLLTRLQNDDHFNLAKREILMRKIGHEVLLHSGDSTSRVLPVTKLPNEKYRLVFEKQFTFEPDTLVAIVRKSLASNKEAHDYIVNVLDCPNAAVVFGYAISDSKKNDVIPCSGRKQPTGCYVITVEFGAASFGIKNYAVAVSVFVVALFPLIFVGYRKKKTTVNPHKPEYALIPIGSILFDNHKKQLIVADEILNLTTKENKLLSIFAQNPNQIIDRARLQKEIWEDDGIIVGRSLDVFISKLRKKLESDAAVQLVNIHGKGYKLQIDATET